MNKILAAFLLFLCTSNAAFALTAKISSLQMTLDLSATSVTTQILTATAKNDYNETTDSVYVLLSDTPFNLGVTDANNRQMNFSVFLANDVYTIQIYDSILSGGTKDYVLTFVNNEIVKTMDNYFLMGYSFHSYYSLTGFSLKAKLPAGYGITEKGGTSIYPLPSHLYSDGQQIIVEWIGNLSYLETASYAFLFEKLSTPGFPFEGFALAGLGGFAVGFAAAYLWSKRKKKEIVTMALTGDEKKVVDMLTATKQDVYQNDIGDILDFSKPKLSKIIHFLEKKNIILITPAGRKNKIELNKKLI